MPQSLAPQYRGKLLYEGLKTQGLAVHAAKYPNVFRRSYGTRVEGKRSTTRFMSSYRLENKGGNPEYL